MHHTRCQSGHRGARWLRGVNMHLNRRNAGEEYKDRVGDFALASHAASALDVEFTETKRKNTQSRRISYQHCGLVGWTSHEGSELTNLAAQTLAVSDPPVLRHSRERSDLGPLTTTQRTVKKKDFFFLKKRMGRREQTWRRGQGRHFSST